MHTLWREEEEGRREGDWGETRSFKYFPSPISLPLSRTTFPRAPESPETTGNNTGRILHFLPTSTTTFNVFFGRRQETDYF